MQTQTLRLQGARSLFAALALSALTAACANDEGTINRVQPNLIEKSLFEGAWYVRQTIVDVPPTTGFTFVGETGELEIIRWEIRENLLVGYRAYEKIPGTDPDADHEGAGVGEQPVLEGHGEGLDPEIYKENPVVAFPIEEHVDVRREYNPATGEQTNVVSENTEDRPWHQRQFMRVDWTDPQVANVSFLFESFRQAAVTGSYWVDGEEQGPDAFRVEKGEEGQVNYFDLTNRLFVQPDLLQFSDGSVYPACYLEYQSDCTSAEVTVRTSFLKVDEARERTYAPLFYDDIRQGEFGYFRTERPTYDRRYGQTYEGMEYLANRHDMWVASLDENGKEIPYEKRELRPIVYTLSENYPQEMLPVTEQIAEECDATFKRIAAFARGQSEKELETDLKEQTGDTCLFCLDLNEDNHARVGDLRYNFLYWVDSPQLASPLGYGPSSAHPETGRIVAGMAYVYGAAVDTYAQRAMDMINLLNGDVDEDEFLSGVDVGKAVSSRRLAIDPRTMERIANTKLSDQDFSLLGEHVGARIATIQKHGFSQRPSTSDARIATILEREGLTDLFITPEMRQDFAAEFGFQSGDVLDAAQEKELRRLVLDPRSEVQRRDALRREAERRSITLADYSDPAILGLAKETRKKKLKGDKLWQYLREQIYRGVMLHELGHTFGLRHNFGGSTDALNFAPDYWPLREKTLNTPATVLDLLRSNCAEVDSTNKAGCDAQNLGKMAEYQYSSIMDYGARFNSDFHGYGLYDVAALASAYGDIVEVFDPKAVNAMTAQGRRAVREAAEIRSPLFGQLGELAHYTRLPQLLGGLENLHKRRWMKRSDYVKQKDEALRVPYVACYDEYRDRTWFCHTWDMGADPFEIANYYVTAYENDYYFNNFARGRLGFGPFDVMQRTASRYFFPMTFAYQDGLFDLIYGTGDQAYQALAQMAMFATFQELWSVLVRPSYGSYQLQNGAYELMSYDPGQFDLTVEPGVGRSTYSRYDLESGYNLLNRVKESGHLYEQIAVLQALTNEDATRLGIGRDVVGGDLAYRIPYYLVFDNELTQLFGSIFVEDVNGFSARIDPKDGHVYPTTIHATLEDGSLLGTPFTSQLPWFIRFNSAVMALAKFRENFSIDYARRCQITLEGSGESFTPAAGYETVRYEDPTSGRVFLAYRDPSDTGRWPAAEKLTQLNALAAQLAAMPNGTAAEKSERQQFQAALRQEVEDVDILRELYNLFGRSPVL